MTYFTYFDTIQYSTLRYNTVQYSTEQYNTYDKYQYVYTIALHNKISTIILFPGINGILVKLYT